MNSAREGRDHRARFHDPASGVFLDQQRLATEQQAGFWAGRIITEFLDKSVQQQPDALALVGYQVETGAEINFTFAQLDDHVKRVAGGLKRLGVQRGDVVSFQLPNWWEFVVMVLACVRIGAVGNPLMPIFRVRELEFMLNRAESKVLVVPKVFRRFDHAAMAKDLQRRAPLLQHVVVVGGGGTDSFEHALLNPDNLEYLAPDEQLEPNDIMKIMFTSGTTGEPKGVMHTSNTMLTAINVAAQRLELRPQDILFMPSPFAHSIGYIYGILMSTFLGVPLVIMDIWDIDRALDLMERHRVTYTFAAPPFLSDLINNQGLEQRNLDSLRLFMTSGAPVPPALVNQASQVLQANIATGWGMTEVGLVTTTLPSMEAAGIGTDGIPVKCSEVRIVDDNNIEVARNVPGNLQCRGSTVFVGYFRRPDLYDLDAQGWFNTGDLASMNDAGYISIVGRSKDIIIRGGENIPVVEVEKLLYEMPQVTEAALVGMPDARLGEKGCAFVTLRPGHTLTMKEMVTFLDSKGLARQYMPERLAIVREIPKTPSGKVQKFILREMVSDLK